MKRRPSALSTSASDAAVRQLIRSDYFHIAERVVLETFRAPLEVRIAPTLQAAIHYEEDLPPYCSLICSSESGVKRCNADIRRHMKLVIAQGKIVFYHCHSGMANICAPIFAEKEVIALLLAGKVLSNPPTENDFLSIWRKLRDLGIRRSELRKAYFATAVLRPGLMKAIMALIQLHVQFLIDAALRMRQLGEDRTDRIVQEVQKFCEREYTRPLRLSEIAHHVHLSPTHLCRLFKQKTGEHLFDFLTRVRLQEAKHLLWTTDSKIAEIAFRTGFENARYFSHIFQVKVGITPTEYRRRSPLKLSA